uniref:Uncharacterized protein n=1 Tax=Cucumis melo TaxID=3656 RepID=A0A9I9ELF0_CUCME
MSSNDPRLTDYTLLARPNQHSLKPHKYAALDFNGATELVKDKKIAIFGFQKSALELIREFTNLIDNFQYSSNSLQFISSSISMFLITNPLNGQPWGIHIDYLFASRFAELLIHKPSEGFLLYLLAVLLAPIMVDHEVGRIPREEDKNGQIRYAVLSERFYERVEEGSIVLKKAPSFSFCEEVLDVMEQRELILLLHN